MPETSPCLPRAFSRIAKAACRRKRPHLRTSGTLATLSGVKLGLPRYNRNRIDGHWLERDEVLGIVRRITVEDFDGRSAIPCVGTDRADLIVPGCAILSEIMSHFPSQHLRVADRGLREGILIGLLKDATEKRPARGAAAPRSAADARA